MKPKQDLRTKNLGKKNKFLLSQLKHSLKSPERFQQYLDGVASWLSRETGLQEVKDAFKAVHSSYLVAPEAARIILTHLLHALIMLFMQNPRLFLGFAYNFVHNAEVRNHYPHTLPEHGSQIVAEGKLSQEQKKGGVIYDRGRITTLDHASSVSGVKLGTLRNYLSEGKLSERGHIFIPGRQKVLIDLDELDSVLSSRKPGGRPRKIPEPLLPKRPRGRPRKTPKTGGVEPKLITLKEAVETHGVGYETLRSWYRSGHLLERGREVFGTHGGGKILVDEQDVTRLKSQPPRRGKPPLHPT
jgi:hypothetical protein